MHGENSSCFYQCPDFSGPFWIVPWPSMGIANNVCLLLGVTDRWGEGCVLSALLCVMNAMYDLLAF